MNPFAIEVGLRSPGGQAEAGKLVASLLHRKPENVGFSPILAPSGMLPIVTADPPSALDQGYKGDARRQDPPRCPGCGLPLRPLGVPGDRAFPNRRGDERTTLANPLRRRGRAEKKKNAIRRRPDGV